MSTIVLGDFFSRDLNLTQVNEIHTNTSCTHNTILTTVCNETVWNKDFGMNKYTCSDGTRISQATIDRRRSEAYRDLYAGEPHPMCGCNKPAQGTAHWVPQKICKDNGIAEYCYLSINMVAACHSCNSSIENISAATPDYWFYERLVEVTKIILPERYLKMI